MLLALSVPDDAVMHVGIDAYLTHLTLIEILTVLVAQRLGDAAVQRLHGVRAALQQHGVDMRTRQCRAGTTPRRQPHEFPPRQRNRVNDKHILLEGGLVIDGSGGPAWPGDVLLVGDRIARLGEGLRERLPHGLTLEELDVIDCRGFAIAPGFIDAHTHDDAIVLRDPACLPKLSQGITTSSPATAAFRWRRSSPSARSRR